MLVTIACYDGDHRGCRSPQCDCRCHAARKAMVHKDPPRMPMAEKLDLTVEMEAA